MLAARRIVSFLPSATEMVCALGLDDELMGITHECDYPPEIRDKPIVVRNVLPVEHMSQLASHDGAAHVAFERIKTLGPRDI